MSLERKKSELNSRENVSGSNDCLLQKRSSKHRDSGAKKGDQMVPRMFSGEEIEMLRSELENETKNRNEAQRKYSELHHKMETFMQQADEAKKNPESKYDNLIYKQNCVNDTVASQNEILKEIKRFERMQIDLKSNLDRLQYKIDHEAKEYYNLADQFQKLQIELYHLQNLNDKHSTKPVW
ncbi:CLUMA_CG015234, isoform A [Clunio marinus]|uniref:CLUMA_CG015234, isoform A n=1 Tax=Clunio marinus TaxID=568069 RepID=A0A1J1IQ03_9DIPT|nr:CLUMA_CG015234, isoform A [Clunio marinus]